MKKNRIIIGFIYLMLLLAILTVIVVLKHNKYSTFLVMNNEGYLVSKNDLTKNLLNDTIDPDNADIKAVPFSVSDRVYKKSGKYYMGNKKTSINSAYPLFINNASAVMCLTDSAGLITDDFEYANSYSGLYISEGISFNPDMERAYREEFILLSLSNGTFVSAKALKVEGNFFGEALIPSNSIIRFMENEIRYYSLNQDTYKMTVVSPLNSSSVITIDDNQYKYFDFLEKLGLYEKEKLREKEEELKKEESEKITPVIPTALPKPDIPDKEEGEQQPQTETGKPEITDRQEITKEATPTPKADEEVSGDSEKPEEPKPAKPTKPLENAIPSTVPDGTVIDQPIQPAKPAKAADAAPLPGVVSPSELVPATDQDNSGETAPDTPPVKEWKKPVVKLGDIYTTVYSLKCPGLNIENPEFLDHSGVTFQIYSNSQKPIISKGYGMSDDVSIGSLEPDKEYKVVVTMNYLDQKDNKASEILLETKIHTKPISDLTPLHFNWSNGNILYDKIQLTDLAITNAIKDKAEIPLENGGTKTVYDYIETVLYMNRVEVTITDKEEESTKYVVPMNSRDLVKLRNGIPILYESAGKINSNTDYYYEFKCIDRFGNILPLDGVVRGTTHTCKQPPRADITPIKNEIKNVEVGIEIQNPDDSDIVEGSTYFVVLDRDNNPVTTTIARKNSDGNYISETDCIEMHPLGIAGETIKFLDLLDNEVYKIQVYSNYNINDNHGNYENNLIGELKVSTKPISDLQSAYFDVSLDEIADQNATITISLNKARTDSLLLALISNIDISFVNSQTMDAAGVSVDYKLSDATSTDAAANTDTTINPLDTGTDSQDGSNTAEDAALDNILTEGGAQAEEQNLTGTVSLSTEEVELLKTGDGEKITFRLGHLSSKTKYNIVITPKVPMGSKGNEVYRKISAFYTPNSFTTFKKAAVINIDAIYASSDFIKLYDVSVSDPDSSIVNYPVTIAVYDSDDNQIATFELINSEKVTLIDIMKLEKNKTYTIRFFAEEFNNGTDMKTYRKHYELYYSKLYDTKQYLKITTQDAVSGSIQLIGTNRHKVFYEKEILAGNIDSKVVGKYKGYRFVSNTTSNRFVYTTTVNFGSEICNSAQIGYSWYSKATDYKLYTLNPDTNPGAIPIATINASEKTTGSEICKWTDIKELSTNLTGIQTIYIVATASDGGTGMANFWGLRFLRTEQSDENHYYANFHVVVRDPKEELKDIPSYYIRIYKDGIWVDTRRHEWFANEDGTYTLRMYHIAEDKKETLVDEKTYQGEDRICDTNFYYEIEKGYHNYTFELWADIFSYQLKLDQESFSSEEEIIAIYTQDDLLNIRYGLDKKYYVMNDIELTLGTNNIVGSLDFNGVLDFRGHTLIYNSQAALIPTIGKRGVLENMVLTYGSTWGTDMARYTDRIITYNYGKIRNIKVIRNNGNVNQKVKDTSAGICYLNYEGGVIENFVIQLKDEYISTNNVAGVCNYNRGIIRNGYIYGKPIVQTNKDDIDEVSYTANNYMGAIVSVNRQGGVVENVYSLIDVKTRDALSVNDYTFNLVGLNDGLIRNSFSAGDVWYGNQIRKDYGPAYRNRYAGSAAKNTYYYSEQDYGATNNPKIAKLVLHDRLWYSRLFDNSTSTSINQFNYEPVSMGFYPHIKWPSFMPDQDYIKLPEITSKDDINIVDTDVIEQGADYAKAVITFNNPDELKITDIKVRWLNAEILSQGIQNNFYRVTVRLTQPSETKYYSSYKITSFTYSLGFQDMTIDKNTVEGKEPVIGAEFYKAVSTVEEWASIKDDYAQNYRLEADINFMDVAPDIVVLPANVTLDPGNVNFKGDAFSGKLDGNGHKISFINTGNNGYVIGKLTGTVKNLTIDTLAADKGDGRFKGFIGRMLEGSLVDNVHVFNMEAVSVENCGAIAAEIYAAEIQNSSAHNIHISTVANGNYTQYVGGLVGKHRVSSINTIYGNMSINNCYVNKVNIEVKAAGDCGGVGGLIGFVRSSAEIYHVYVVNGKIDTVYKNAGGLIGAVDTFTNSESAYYMLKDFYVDVDITSITERVGGVIGFTTVSNGELNANGLVLGNISTSLPAPDEAGRFYGVRNLTDVNKPYAVYGYENSYLLGKLNSNPSSDPNTDQILTSGEIDVIKNDLWSKETIEKLTEVTNEKLLAREVLMNPETYQMGGLLCWDSDFARDEDKLKDGYLPMLMDVNCNSLLPYQEDYCLEKNAITIKSISSQKYSSGENYIVSIETEHDAGVKIEEVTFSGLNYATIPGVDTKIIDNGATSTSIVFIMKISGYYDAYYLTGFQYTKAEDSTEYTQNMYQNVGIAPQFFPISSAFEWNSYMDPNVYGKLGYNILITGDLDFSEILNGDAVGDVVVNQLRGDVETKDQYKTIKGIRLKGEKSFLKAAYGNISFLNFEDIQVTRSNSDPNCANINSLGLFTAVTGDIYNTNFKDILVDAYHTSYVGIAALSYGMNYNINMSNITVNSNYKYLPAKRAAGGLVGRLSGSGGVYDTVAENITVQGRDYVGGIVGTQEEGRYIWHVKLHNALVCAVAPGYSGSYVGGIIGYAYVNLLGNTFGYNEVKQAVIMGNNYVGGIVGLGNTNENSAYKNEENDSYYSRADKVFVLGTGVYVGGIAGQGLVRRAEVRNSYVYGNYYIGGITGNGSTYFVSCLDSVIGTFYDRDVTDVNNKWFQDSVNSQISIYSGLEGDAGAKAVYSKIVSSLNSLSSRYGTWSTTNYTGSNNSRIGGIAGRSITICNSVAANCRIGSYGAKSVGGIIGMSEIGSDGTWPYRIIASSSINCSIYGSQDIGGIVGTHYRTFIESCYSNADVTSFSINAVDEMSGSCAGGIVGRMIPTGLYSLSEKPYIRHVYYAGTVTAKSFVAGIVGMMQQDFYNINDGWLMVGNVKLTGTKGDFFYNKQDSFVGSNTNSLVYNNSTITINGVVTTAADFYGSSSSMLVTTDQLKDVNTYTNTLKLGYSSTIGITPTNYTSRYWNYGGLINGYMPYLTFVPMNNYNMTSALRIMKYQEGYLPDPNNSGKAAIDEEGFYKYRYETYKGGIPIPGSGNTMVMRSFRKIMPSSIPVMDYYTVDADKLNLEFSEINPAASFIISAAGQQVAQSNITKRTFTLDYDFRTELEIIVTDGTDEISYTIWPEDVSRNIMTAGSDYYYITMEGVLGSRATLSGVYVNLYAGHALNAYGEVCNVDTGTVIRTIKKIQLNENTLPLYHFDYDKYSINTYKNFSEIDTITRDKFRMLVKNNELSAISANLPVTADGFILDNYNGNHYCSVLSLDGTIVDMTDLALNYPKDFANENILAMTNNINSTNHIVLVRYYDGAVAGFNYITGEKLDIISPRGSTTNLTDDNGFGGRSKFSSMTNFDSKYLNVQELETNLTEVGWAEVNGVSDANGNAVSEENEQVVDEAGMVMYVESTSESISDSVSDQNTLKENSSLMGETGLTKEEAAADSLQGDIIPGTESGVESIAPVTEEDPTVSGAIDGVSSQSPSGEASQITQGQIPAAGTLPEGVTPVPGNGSMDGSGVTTDDSGTITNGLGISDNNETGESSGGAGIGTDSTKEDTVIDNKQEDDIMKEQNSLNEAANEEKDSKVITEADQKENSSEEFKNTANKAQNIKYVPVYDVDSSKYVLYNEDELLSMKDEALETMDKKLERSGHMIDFRTKQQADNENPGDDNVYGYMLLAVAFTGIAFLLSCLILKKRKEAGI